MRESFGYAQYVVALAAAWFAMNMPIYLAVDMHIFSAPYYWALILAVLTAPAIILRCAHWDMLKCPLSLWCMVFLWVTIGGFFISSQTPEIWREVSLRVFAVGEMVWLYVLFTEHGTMKWAQYGLILATCVNVGLNMYEFFFPLTFSSTYGRSAGFHGNPNQSADAIVLGTLFSLPLLPWWLRLPYLFASGIGVLLTFSRSGIVAWTLIATMFVVARMVKPKHVLVAGAVGVLLGVAMVAPFLDDVLKSWDQLGGTNKDLIERLDFFTNPTSVVDASALARAYVAAQAWQRIADHPLLGRGTGTSANAMVGAHNAYLEFMEDHGVFGVLLLPLLVLAATWGARGDVRHLAWCFSAVLLWQGFFSHGILSVEFRTLIVALMAAMVWYNQEQKFVEDNEVTGDSHRHARTWVEA